MRKEDVGEAAAIVERTLQTLLAAAPSEGSAGADLRTAVGDILAHVKTLLHDDAIGEPLDECFDLAQQAGATVQQIEVVRKQVMAEAPTLLGGALMQDALVQFCLATQSRIIADMTFTSREDAEQTKLNVNAAFAPAEETMADNMDAASYRALVSLHAATTHHLVTTARPLPQMLAFVFAAPLTTLVAAHKLYANAARADQLREENKVVHPAFMQRMGRALSR